MNTDEFEGHTPGPWAYCEDEVYAEGNPIIVALRAHGSNGELTSKLPHRWADFALIAAAPDLLQALIDEQAEVKRLREQLDNARHWVSLYEDEDMMSNFKMWIGEEE